MSLPLKASYEWEEDPSKFRRTVYIHLNEAHKPERRNAAASNPKYFLFKMTFYLPEGASHFSSKRITRPKKYKYKYISIKYCQIYTTRLRCGE